MIVSHKYGFIYTFPAKTGGTSVKIAISPYCGPNDIIANIFDFDKKRDSDNYKSVGNIDFHEHAPVEEMLEKGIIDQSIISNYYSVTQVRNPWDRYVSLYYWCKWIKETNLKFDDWISEMKIKDTYYFLPEGTKIFDFAIRYENLQKDYCQFCDMFKIPCVTLIRTKDRVRKNQDYRSMYTQRTKAIVSKRHEKMIDHFGYRF